MMKIISVAALASGAFIFVLAQQYSQILDCDGYGTRCAYPVEYASKPFVRNAIEADTADRAAKILVDMTAPPVKFQDRLANR